MIRNAAALLALATILPVASPVTSPAAASDRYSKALRYVDQSGIERVAGERRLKALDMGRTASLRRAASGFVAADQIVVIPSGGVATGPAGVSRGTTIGPFTVQQPVRDPNPPAIRKLAPVEPTRISAFGLSWEAPISHKGKYYPARCFPDCVPEEDR
jgi:hypothetical protein